RRRLHGACGPTSPPFQGAQFRWVFCRGSRPVADGVRLAVPVTHERSSTPSEGVSGTTTTPFQMSRIGRHGLVYAAGLVLSKAVAFVMLPVYTRYLTPADYGLLQLLDMVLEVASIVAGSRLGAGIFRYYHKADSTEGRRAVLSTAAVVLGATYAFAATLLYWFSPTIAQVVLGGPKDVALVRIA